MDPNLMLIKDAAVRCLATIAIDCPTIRVSLPLPAIVNLLNYRRVSLTQSVLYFCRVYLAEGLLAQELKTAGLL